MSDRQSCPEPLGVPTCCCNSEEHVFMINQNRAPAEPPRELVAPNTAGIDWASTEHAVAVVDSHGAQLERFTTLWRRCLLDRSAPCPRHTHVLPNSLIRLLLRVVVAPIRGCPKSALAKPVDLVVTGAVPAMLRDLNQPQVRVQGASDSSVRWGSWSSAGARDVRPDRGAPRVRGPAQARRPSRREARNRISALGLGD